MGAAGRAGARPRKLSRPPSYSGRFVARGVLRISSKPIVRAHLLVESGSVERKGGGHGANARPAVAKRAMDRRLHLQRCTRRHGCGAWLGLSALVYHSIAERNYCSARFEREIFRCTFFAARAGPWGLTCRGTRSPPQFRDMNKFAIGCGAVIVILVFIVIIAAVALGGSYNRLVRLQQSVDQSLAQVQNVYQRRADLIPNLVNTVSGAANFEKSTLVEVTNARASVGRVQLDPNKAPTDAAQLQQFQAAQGQLSNALSRLLVVAENYPQLTATQNFRELQTQLEGTENRISVERNNFNAVVQDYNTALRRFPTNTVAGMFGFQQRPFFAAQQGAEKAPTVTFP